MDAISVLPYNTVDGYAASMIRSHLRKVISSLRRRHLWEFIDPSTRGWLKLASSLEGIKFRSRKVLSVLVSILKRVEPLLRIVKYVKIAGLADAWRSSELAFKWGNEEAKRWRFDSGYQFYCGLLLLQASKIIPGVCELLARWMEPTLWRYMRSLLRSI